VNNLVADFKKEFHLKADDPDFVESLTIKL